MLEGNKMNLEINKDTVLCMSLSSHPGNFGTRFQNFLYREMGLNFMYKAFTTQNLLHAVQGIRALGIRGSAISMPFKEEVIQYLDQMDPSASRIDAVNTIVNTCGVLKGYNTDAIAIDLLLQKHQIGPDVSTAVLGSGGMAKAVVSILHQRGFKDCTVFSRNPKAGPALAQKYGYSWKRELDDRPYEFLINVTPIGMLNDKNLPFPLQCIEACSSILDVVANPVETEFIKLAKSMEKEVITGLEVIVLQAIEQFQLYTDATPSEDLVRRASEWARR
jgi:shikimate dehydrogenase